MDFPGGSDGKASAYNAGDPGSIPGLGRFPREGNGNPLQYSCLENSMDRGAWWAIVHGIAESHMTEQLHGILQARILEWVAISFSRGFFQPRNQTQVSCTAGRFFTN